MSQIKVKIGADTSEYNLKLQKVVSKAKSTGKEIKQNIEKSGKNLSFGQKLKAELQKVKKGIEATGQSGEKLSKIGDFFSAGKLAIVAALFVTIGKSIADIWDKATLSSEEYVKKQEMILKDIQQHGKETKEQHKIDNQYLQYLKKLAQLQYLNSQQKKIAIDIIERLTSRYKDLGISVDNATGAIEGLYDAQAKMTFQQQKENYKNIVSEKENIEALGDKKMTLAFNKLQSNTLTEWLNKALYEYFDIVHENVAYALEQVQNKPIDKQIEFFKELRKHVKTEEQLNAVQEIIDLKTKQLKLQEKIAFMKKAGLDSDEAYFKYIQKVLDNAEYNQNEETIYKEKKAIDDLKKSLDALEQNHKFAMLQTAAEKVEFLEEKVKKLNETLSGKQVKNQRYEKMLSMAKQFRQNAIKRIEEEQKKPSWERSRSWIKRDQEKIINENRRIHEFTAKKSVSDREILQIEKNKKALEAQIEKIKKAAQRNIFSSIQGQAYGLLDKLTPNSPEYMASKKIRELEKSAGVELSDQQRDDITKLSQLQFELNNLDKLDLSKFDIKTNSLTARGGFATGAIATNTDRINSIIMSNSTRQVNLLSQVKSLLERIEKNGGYI